MAGTGEIIVTRALRLASSAALTLLRNSSRFPRGIAAMTDISSFVAFASSSSSFCPLDARAFPALSELSSSLSSLSCSSPSSSSPLV
eukprot:12345_2